MPNNTPLTGHRHVLPKSILVLTGDDSAQSEVQAVRTNLRVLTLRNVIMYSLAWSIDDPCSGMLSC